MVEEMGIGDRLEVSGVDIKRLGGREVNIKRLGVRVGEVEESLVVC